MYGEEPKCSECLPVKLQPENWTLYQVYSRCGGQHIMAGDSGPVDIQAAAVFLMLDEFGITARDDRIRAYDMISRAYHATQAILAEKRRERIQGTRRL